MKKQIIRMVFAGTFLMCLNTSNAGELKPEIKNGNKLLEIKKNAGSDDDGIKGKIMVNAGVGLNGTRSFLRLQYRTTDSTSTSGPPNITSSTQIPLLNIGVDYGFAKRFSVGAAFGYQSIKLNAGAGSNFIAGTDTWTRLHIAVRGDYYIVAKENLNLYTGLKVGYNIYNVKSTYTKLDPNYISKLETYVSGPLKTGVQAHFGFSYFFNGMIGINTEVGLAIGGPYFFAAGLGFKF